MNTNHFDRPLSPDAPESERERARLTSMPGPNHHRDMLRGGSGFTGYLSYLEGNGQS